MDYSSPGRVERPDESRQLGGAARRLFPGLEVSQHFLSNLPVTPLSVDVDRADDFDVAEARIYVRAECAEKRSGRRHFTIGGYYIDRLVRFEAGWRISAVALI